MSSSTIDRPLLPPQTRTISRVVELIESGRNVVLQSPTGSGKTLMSTELMKWAEPRGGGIFYVNRKSLVSQTRISFERSGVMHGVRASEHEEAFDPGMAIQIASADTERVRVYGDKAYWNRHECSLVVVDEAHIQKGDTMKRILDDHIRCGAKVVLMSATPIAMARVLPNAELVIAGTLGEFRDCGLLVPAVVKSIEQPDLSKVKRNATGEYVIDGKKRKIYTQSIVGNVIDRWKRYNPDARPTMLYAPGKPESVWMCKQFNDIGVPWCHVDATEAYCDGKRYTITRTLWEDILGKYRDGVFKGISSRFKCLDEKTEVLTRDGWKGWADFDIHLEVATMSPDGVVHWEKAEKRFYGDSDRWCVIKNVKGMDIRVTDDHDMIFRSADRRCVEWKKIEATDLANRPSSYQIPVAAMEHVEDMPLTDDEIAVIGWMMTDGHVRNYGAWVINQSCAQPEYIHDHIKKSLLGAGMSYTEASYVSRYDGVEFPFKSYRIGINTVRSRKFSGLMSKHFDMRLMALSRRQLLVLLEAINLADGSKRKNATWTQRTLEISKGNVTFLSRLQALCVVRGMRANLFMEHECPRLCITTDRDYATIRGTSKDGDKHKRVRMEREDRFVSEPTWCLQVPTGTLITRRNGKVAIVGNCREGIDLPSTYHIILATPIGSLASYLQTVGRGLRVSPGKDHCLITDHGGAYWRHGSPNKDRDWKMLWKLSEAIASNVLQTDIRNGDAKEPIRCPACEGERLGGLTCPHCGHTHSKSQRHVIMEDGLVTTVDGALVPAKRTKVLPDTQKKWDKMYFGLKRKRSKLTFAQMEGWFAHEHGYWPSRTLNNQPVEKADWHYPVCDVVMSHLRRAE